MENENDIVYITTVDNPWNPFTNWDEWLRYDIEKGYYTCERLARLAPLIEDFPDSINDETVKEAMDRMIKDGAYNKSGEFIEYKLIYKSIIKSQSNQPKLS